MNLFPKHQKVGVFRGYREGGLEFHADLAIPYKQHLQNVPMHGQFLLVQLENQEEAVLGRITSMRAEGALADESGERYSIRAMNEDRSVAEHLREDFLRYRIDIRVLGVIRVDGQDIVFAPSHRRLPHVGSPVAFPSDELLERIVASCNKDPIGAELGFFALGEYIYAGNDPRLDADSWVQRKNPKAIVRFDVRSLVSRRTFIFARAGYGKSNLNKLLFSSLYQTVPTIRRGGRDVPVGTIIFDPDGEYAWPDDDNNPGLCDVDALRDRLVVFTEKAAPSDFYGSFVLGGVKLDIRRLNPSDVISIALNPDRQEQQNVKKLRGLNQGNWSRLVDLIFRHRNSADINQIAELLNLENDRQQVEAFAARSNMTSIVSQLHDPTSQVLDSLLRALSEGKLCIVDISRMRGDASLKLSSLLLRRIFDHNLEEFTKKDPKSIPTIAVIEEAQAVLASTSATSEPYLEWVKEGRKYGLGAVMITQQPGSIPNALLSQGDNWFVFHLLSESDLQHVKAANAHFSRDLLSLLLNEPIPGQGVFWSSLGGAQYPLSLRVLSFRKQHPVFDPDRNGSEVTTYAGQLRQELARSLAELTAGPTATRSVEESATEETTDDSGPDVFELTKQRTFAILKADPDFSRQVNGGGIPWFVVIRKLEQALPPTLHDRNGVAANLVVEAMTAILGKQKQAWDAELRDTASGKRVRMIFRVGAGI
jgi:uncharacterized protein